MRKNKLIEQNLSLFEELQKTRHEFKMLKDAFDKNVEVISALKVQLEEAKSNISEPIVTEPMRHLEEKIINNASLKPDMEYGAKIIGKLVVYAAEYSNKLTIGGYDSKKELLSLILGKTEIAKAEILAVIETDDSFEVKCAKIDQIAEVTNEYYKSVLAQIV